MARVDAQPMDGDPAGAIDGHRPQAHPRLRGLLAPRFADPGLEQAYHAYFLDSDKRYAVLAIGVYALLKACFAALDILLQPAEGPTWLLASRFGFVGASILAMVLVPRIRSRRQHDTLMFLWAMLLVASTFYTLSRRPPDSLGFLITSPMTVLLLFAFFRNRFELQLASACLLAGGHVFILLAMRAPLPLPVLVQIGLSYALVFVAGIVVSRELKLARRRVFAALVEQREAAEAMRELAFRDELTGVLNRRSFLQLAAAGWSRRAAQDGGCVLILDLDHFKTLNDRHGHEVGDQALVRFARMVEAVKREGDLFGRIGGEEFALLLPGIPHSRAQVLAEAIVAGCRALQAGGQTMSVSIGLARIRQEDATLSACMLRADRALYRAKADGRGCIRSADEGGAPAA
jgi:diguanylate cyclase (GGDEF)-like protein